MAKVFPQRPISSPFISFKRETFTIWMKSLLCHGNGCTVFDSNGEIVYRVDNYDEKCRNEVFVMDPRGKVLISIRRRKRLLIFGRWFGYKWNAANISKELPWFQVRRCFRLFMGNLHLACQVTVELDEYWVVKLASKAAFSIINVDGHVVAEVKQKKATSGIKLGDDVLTLIVEPQVDHSLIMAIVTVYGLINQQM